MENFYKKTLINFVLNNQSNPNPNLGWVQIFLNPMLQ